MRLDQYYGNISEHLTIPELVAYHESAVVLIT